MTSELRFIIDGQHLERTDNNIISAGSVAVPVAIFDNMFEVWSEYAAFNVEFSQGETTITVPLIGTNRCDVPHEVLNEGYVTISAYAETAEGNVITTDTVDVEIKRGPKKKGDNSAPFTMSEKAAIQAKVTEAVDIANSVRNDANNGVFNGAPGTDGASFVIFSNLDILKNYPTTTTATEVRFIWAGDDAEYDYNISVSLKKYGVYDGFIYAQAGHRLFKSITEVLVLSGDVNKESVKAIVDEYLEENPIEGGMTEEQAQQLEWNTTDIDDLKNNKADKKDVPTTAADVGAEPEGAVSEHNNSTNAHRDLRQEIGSAKNSLSVHNVSEKAHNDIRLLITDLTNRLNALADSDDVTLDQLSEIVSYIKSNKSLIEAITTNIGKALADANKYTDDSLAVFEEGYSEMYTQLLEGLYGEDYWGVFQETGEFVPIEEILRAGVKDHNTNEQAHSDIRTLINDIATGKLDASKLTEAINTALAQAKESGEFNGEDGHTPYISDGNWFIGGIDTGIPAKGTDGSDGRRGTGLLPVTTAPSAYTTAVNGLTPAYRISLSTVKTQASTTEVYAGDTIRQSYYHYPVIYVDASYVYCGTRVSIRGGTGSAGKTPVKGTDYFTDADKTEMVNAVIAALPTTEGVGF